MKSKNPILNFRLRSDFNPLSIGLKRHAVDKGFHEENVKSIMREPHLSATLITKTREAADMSESSS